MKLNRSGNIGNNGSVLAALLAGLMFSSGAFPGPEAPQANVTPSTNAAPADNAVAPQVFARVGDVVITMQDYDAALALAARNKFYHGKPPEAELAVLQREVGDKLVADVLLVKEARRRGLKPDDTIVAQRLEQIDQRNLGNEQWQKMRTEWLPILTGRIQEENLLVQLESAVRDVPLPNETQIREYYNTHPEKFTEPEQLRVSLILLAVEPSSPGEKWMKTYELGQDLVKQLRAGADFAALAREHPGDAASAEQGGDMGYLHGGMLPDAAQQTLDKLKIGEISDPVRLLEGIAIFRLTDRNLAKLNDFEAVRERASELWLKEERERVWKLLIAQLKKASIIQVDESHYAPLPIVAEEQITPEAQ